MQQLEGRTTRIYNYALGGFGEKKKKKKEDWEQVLAQVPILKKKKELQYGEIRVLNLPQALLSDCTDCEPPKLTLPSRENGCIHPPSQL